MAKRLDIKIMNRDKGVRKLYLLICNRHLKRFKYRKLEVIYSHHLPIVNHNDTTNTTNSTKTPQGHKEPQRTCFTSNASARSLLAAAIFACDRRSFEAI
jgi:hypothetical protein